MAVGPPSTMRGILVAELGADELGVGALGHAAEVGGGGGDGDAEAGDVLRFQRGFIVP